MSDECSNRLRQISRMNVLSDMYILPYIVNSNLETNYTHIDIDRFKFDLRYKVASGSFGTIYTGTVKDVSDDPLANEDSYTSTTYVVKIINFTSDITLDDIDDVSIEVNIQHLLYSMINDGIKTPYIYKKLFLDRKNMRMAFVSEMVNSMDFDTLMCGITKSGAFVHDGVDYYIFQRDVLNKLNLLYRDMSVGDGNILFKHNDLHSGNVLLIKRDDGGLDYKIIDYGLSTIDRLYTMYLNNNIVDYLNKKVDTYIKLYKDLSIDGDSILEFKDYMIEKPMSDYHLYVFSTCNRIFDYGDSILESEDAGIVEQSYVNMTTNRWQQYIIDVADKYSFLSDLSVEGYDILYRGEVIRTDTNYIILYDNTLRTINKINDIELSQNDELSRSFVVKLISNWYIRYWRYISLFIEYYMKDFDEYIKCITPY